MKARALKPDMKIILTVYRIARKENRHPALQSHSQTVDVFFDIPENRFAINRAK